jgi:TolA-binding protein
VTDTANLIARLDDVADALECFGEDKHPADIRKEAARDIREAIDALTRLSQRIVTVEEKRREAEYVATQCREQRNAANARIAALESEIAARESAEPIGESAFDPELGTFWEIHASAENFAVGTKAYAHPPAAAASADARDAVIQECIKACTFKNDPPITPEDHAYDLAVQHCIENIRAIAAQKEKEHG